MITTEQLEKFKAIYRKEFGKDISNQDALDSATKLVNLMRIVYKPITQKDYDEFKKRRISKAHISRQID
jgi:hypothetical protein